jgi:hypothetical protein
MERRDEPRLCSTAQPLRAGQTAGYLCRYLEGHGEERRGTGARVGKPQDRRLYPGSHRQVLGFAHHQLGPDHLVVAFLHKPSSRQGTTQKVAYTGTAGTIPNGVGAQTYGVGAQTYQVRIVCTTGAFVPIGDSPTATTSDMPTFADNTSPSHPVKRSAPSNHPLAARCTSRSCPDG